VRACFRSQSKQLPSQSILVHGVTISSYKLFTRQCNNAISIEHSTPPTSSTSLPTTPFNYLTNSDTDAGQRWPVQRRSVGIVLQGSRMPQVLERLVLQVQLLTVRGGYALCGCTVTHTHTRTHTHTHIRAGLVRNVIRHSLLCYPPLLLCKSAFPV